MDTFEEIKSLIENDIVSLYFKTIISFWTTTMTQIYKIEKKHPYSLGT